MRQPKPGWKKTNTPWEIEKVIWLRWALGDTKKETVHYLDGHRDEYPNAPVHRDTIKTVRGEFLALPSELLDKLISDLPEIEHFVKEKRPDYLQKRPGKYTPPSPHTIELSATALAIAKNLEKYRQEKAACIGSPHCLGDALYEQNATAILANLDHIEREKATDLFSHLKDDSTELKGLTDWEELKDDLITTSFINRLELKAHEGKFKGRCPHCPK